MSNNINYYQYTEKIDPEWVKEIAKYSFILNNALTDKEKKFILELFLDYKNEGLNSSSAMKKAILVFDNFKS